MLLGAKSSLSIVDDEFLIKGNYLELAGLELVIQTFRLQIYKSTRGERLTIRAIKQNENVINQKWSEIKSLCQQTEDYYEVVCGLSKNVERFDFLVTLDGQGH